MYKLKQIPQDFIVIEEAQEGSPKKLAFVYFKIRKTNRTTLDVVKQLANSLRVKQKEIGFAGTKDKHAITTQIFSVPQKRESFLKNLTIDNVEMLGITGYSQEPVTLGRLYRNNFEIVVRNLQDDKVDKVSKIINYYDEQRFSKHNVEIGKNLVLKKFADACSVCDNPVVEQHLKNKPTDFVGALRRVQPRMLRFYVHAYQSYLWNKCVSLYVSTKQVSKTVPYSLGTFIFSEDLMMPVFPLIGFGTDLEDYDHDTEDIITKIMEEEKLHFTDFIIKAIPELSVEGGERSLWVNIENLKIGSLQDDELNEGKKRTITFTLQPGSYATMVIKRIIEP